MVYLTSNADFIQLLESDGSFRFVCIIEDDSDGSSRDPSLSPFVDEIQQILRANLAREICFDLVKVDGFGRLKRGRRWTDGGEIRDAEDEANRVEDVGFPGTISIPSRASVSALRTRERTGKD